MTQLFVNTRDVNPNMAVFAMQSRCSTCVCQSLLKLKLLYLCCEVMV